MPGHASDLPSIDAFVGAGGGPAAVGSAGAVAALNVALAADLAAQVAHASPAWIERGGALAQADAIRDRAVALAVEVEHTYRAALVALADAVETGAPAGGGPRRLGEQLNRVVDELLEIGRAGSDAAMLAELVATSGESIVRANAVAATMLAAAAAEICVHLIEINLLMAADDERVGAARTAAEAAAACREAARKLGR